VLLVSIDLERAASLVADQMHNTEIFVLDEDNGVAARYPRRAANKFLDLPIPVREAVDRLTYASFLSTDGSGQRSAYAVHYLPYSPARLLVAIPLKGPILAAQEKARWAYINAAIVGLCILFFAIIAGQFFLLGPFRALTSAAAAIAHGDLTARARMKFAPTEFKDLAAAFNFMADQVQRLAGTDTLTAIANRREFDAKLAGELSRCQRAGTQLNLALIDVDRFKHFNDSLGHVAGDACLQQVGLMLAEHARRPGDVAARFGGDEFALLLADMTLEEAAAHCERLREAVANAGITYQRNPGGIVTISIGLVSRVPALDETATDFLRDADEALYAAKTAGRNHVWLLDKRATLAMAS
jgi:diguanylate cyclase (GGDEF)-like protein